MDSSDVVAFLQHLGCQRIRAGSSWVRSTCPLAPWRHSGARDKHPSFAVSISPGNTSSGNCLACGWKGSLIPLLWYLDDRGIYVDKLAAFVVSCDQPDKSEKDEGERIVRKVKSSAYWGFPKIESRFKPEPPKVISEDRLQGLRRIPGVVLEYLRKQRRLTRETVDFWELGYSSHMHRVVIPIRNREGQLVAMSGRSVGSRMPKYLHYPKGFKRNTVLYGEDKVREGQTGYLHEGFFSCMYAWQYGYGNNVARMGTHLSEDQADKLVEWFDRLIIVPDGDAAGYRSAEEIYARVRDRIPTVIAPMPEGFEVDRLSREVLTKVMGDPKPVVDSAVVAN